MGEPFIVANPDKRRYLDSNSLGTSVKFPGLIAGSVPEILVWLLADGRFIPGRGMNWHLDRARRYHEAIRRILLHEWDPIGVADVPEAQDEDDGHVHEVHGLLVPRGRRAGVVRLPLRGRMLDLLPHLSALTFFGLFLVAWPILMMWFVRLQQRRQEARLDQHMRAASASLETSRQYQDGAKARALENQARLVESSAMQHRALEIAERSLQDRQEMLVLLRRIVELLESRAQR